MTRETKTPVATGAGKRNQQNNVTIDSGAKQANKGKSKLFAGNQIRQEMERVARVQWVIESFIPQTSNIIALYGAPSSFKSFLALDMMLTVANGKAYHGLDAEPGKVVYIAAEGGAGLWKRVVAWHNQHGLTEISDNFIVHDGAINLHDAQELQRLIDELLQANINPSFVVIDTLARCFGELDENSNAAMSAAVNACDLIREALNTKVLLVHHSGKDKTKGMRGGSALPGGVDTTFEATAAGNKVCKLTVRKQKDGEDGQEYFYKLTVVDLGIKDLKGNAITSLVPELDKNLRANDKPQLIGKKSQVYNALIAAIKESGNDGATLEQWRDAYYKAHGNIPSEKTAFSNYHKELLSSGHAYLVGETCFLSDRK